MSDVPMIAPQLPIVPLIGALVTSTLYALLLNTRLGRKWADEQTWATVVVGSAMTLAWLATFRLDAAGWALLFFGVTGIPIIIRSLALQLEKLDKFYDRAIRPEDRN